MSQARKEKLSFRAGRESVWLRCNTQPPDNKFIAAHTELFALGGAARGDSDQCLENLQSHLIQVSLPVNDSVGVEVHVLLLSPIEVAVGGDFQRGEVPAAIVLDCRDAYVQYGSSPDRLEHTVELQKGDLLNFPPLEWHVFRYREGGYLDALCIYGQVTNIRPEEIEPA